VPRDGAHTSPESHGSREQGWVGGKGERAEHRYVA